jgi:starch-binding outer membrane protein, SusD/RagB family
MNIMNKKIKSIFFLSALCAGASLTSCTDLDSDKYFDDRITEEQIFSEKSSAEEWLAHAYTWLLDCNVEVSSKGGTGSTTVNVAGKEQTVEGANWNPFNFCDDIYYGDRDNKIGAGDNKDADYASYNSFREGNYQESCGYAAWIRCYKGIYQASIFIHKIDLNEELSAEEIEDYRGQARFVRAYYYWLLLRKYGPVPIMPDEGVDYTKSYEDLSIPRSTYEEVADYIGTQMVQAAKEITTLRRDANNVCRPTRGTCLATRAMAYIYAASPLANGQLQNGYHPASVTDDIAKLFVNKDGTKLLSTTYDESKWARAAAACKDVMELGCYELYHAGKISVGQDGYPVTVTPDSTSRFATQTWPNGYADIDPMQSYRQIFDGDVYPADNTELIFTRGINFDTANNDLGIGALVLHEMPVLYGGWNTHGVTQKMCDTYYMADGTDVDGMYSEWRGTYPSTVAEGNSRPRNSNVFSKDDLKEFKTQGIDDPCPELGRIANQKSLTNAMLQNISRMYTKREPRFYASVAHSGTVWEFADANTTANKFKQVNYYRNGGNGWVNNFQYLRTGIGMRKYCSPKDYCPNNQNTYSGISAKYEPAMRYADILLMYAEALNELTSSYQVASWDGSTTYTISRDINEIKKGTNPVRIRAGLPDYDEVAGDEDIYNDAKALRMKIKRERMIEFMGEGKRYFDLRRWMDAPVEEATPVYGLNVFMTTSEKNEFFKVIPTYNLSATFSTKLYFWPIAHTELKRNSNLVQSPGWTDND